MKKKYLFFYIVFIFLLTGTIRLRAQNSIVSTTRRIGSGAKIKWTANPFDHQVFIENGGQFTGPPSSDKILYGAQVGDVYVFITPHGLIYKYTQHPKEEEHAGKDADPDDIVQPVDYYITSVWEGSNEATNIISGEEQTNYYTYPGPDNKSTIKASIFKTITCKDIYPGIDVKYSFIPGKDGFKYALIVHPGADISQIKLKYEGAKKMSIDKNGNVQINSGWGAFTDHAPKSYYNGESDTIVSGYQLQNNTESFHVRSSDPAKTLVIDPWATNWTTPYNGNGGHNGAYDVDYDYAGNIYIAGSFNPWQVAKYNSAGVQQWTYNCTNLFVYNYYGAFCVDKITGSSFCMSAITIPNAYIDKLTTSGTLVNTLTSGTLYEQWRAAYDVCSHQVIIGGGGTQNTYQAATLDTLNSTCTRVNILGVPAGHTDYDMCVMSLDPIVDSVYMATARSSPYPNYESNYSMRAPGTTLTPTTYAASDGFGFSEVSSITYVGTNAMNGMAVSPNWTYMYDGQTLAKMSKSTGSVIGTTTVSNNNYTWGGIDVDLCDNIYLGNGDSIDIYNSLLTYQGAMGAFTGDVYDVVLNRNPGLSSDSTLYVCGNGFVASVEIDPPSPPVIKKTFTHACTCTCTGDIILL